MWRQIAIHVFVGSCLVLAWYWVCLQLNRRKCQRILSWVEGAFGSYGHVAGVRWLSPSRFQVHLRLSNCGFMNPSIHVQLAPRELPFRWFMSRFRKQPETMTFEANLHCAPGFNLDVQNHRWCGKSRRRLNIDKRNWITERVQPMVITSRTDWHRDITNMMNALVASRECNFLKIAYRRSSPHFTATVPLHVIVHEHGSDTGLVEALRDLAAGASASRF